jgi:hypothetical protein
MWLVLTDHSIDDSAGGNGDGLVQRGETVELTVELSSITGDDATDVSIELTAGESMVTVIDGLAALPDVPAGGSSQNGSDPLSFEITGALPDTVATLWATVTANGGAYTGTGRIDIHIDLSATGIEDEHPAVLSLRPGYPNPFSAATHFEMALPSAGRVDARVYSPSGRLVRTLQDGELPAGVHRLDWDGRDELGMPVASGVYFVRLEAGAGAASRKVVLLR